MSTNQGFKMPNFNTPAFLNGGKYQIFNSFVLKLIAIITMVIDHVGLVFFPNIGIFRIIGRLAFPLFAFLLVEGFFHTRSVKLYLLRLGVFAIISQIPFSLAFFGKVFYYRKFCSFVTLFIGLTFIYLFETYENLVYRTVFIVASLLVAYAINCDYSVFGIATIFIFYFFRDQKLLKYLAFILLELSIPWEYSSYAILAIIPIELYNGKKGPSNKKFFYIFYPTHLLIIAFIKFYMYGMLPWQ